tara:strand:- start:1308 stop:1901 length:594 start_codon:yes stop_codon:yes gene_type:complete
MKQIKNFFIVLIIFFLFIFVLNFLPKVTDKIKYLNYLESYGKIYNHTLFTHKNVKISKKDFENKVSAIFFGFTNCPDVCPITLSKITEAISQVDSSSKINFYFVTLDPERDGVDELREYLEIFNDRVTGITGEKAEIKKLAKSLNIKFVKRILDDDYTIDHTASVILLDQNQKIFDKIYFEDTKEKSSEKLLKLINY